MSSPGDATHFMVTAIKAGRELASPKKYERERATLPHLGSATICLAHLAIVSCNGVYSIPKSVVTLFDGNYC